MHQNLAEIQKKKTCPSYWIKSYESVLILYLNYYIEKKLHLRYAARMRANFYPTGLGKWLAWGAGTGAVPSMASGQMPYSKSHTVGCSQYGWEPKKILASGAVTLGYQGGL